MDGIRIILIIVAALIIIVNLFINFSNIFKIVSYCFKTNSLSQYWNLFFKSCISGRAIISSVFAIVLAIIIFVIITPIVLIRRATIGKKTAALIEEGILFEYQDMNLSEKNITFNSNLQSLLGISLTDDAKATGNIKIDATLVVTEIQSKIEAENKSFSFKAMHNITLNDGKDAIIPLFITIDKTSYPTYFIYNEKHKAQFQKIEKRLYSRGYKSIYFSVINM
ncbi:hypothetical protein [Winogradskyella sp.]|jgi:hypothetical protein|uniref:hypothetical protein n=1 Tax=Winogradskyella sp. TaxID=1883156 RepID=UPI002600F915|nr:hypothetical protein [Winogradskyella sp.]MCT4629727.1 hypothetical protein [Winogradskyella sp.]